MSEVTLLGPSLAWQICLRVYESMGSTLLSSSALTSALQSEYRALNGTKVLSHKLV